MRRTPTLLVAALLALSLPLMAAARDGDIDKVNGSVQVEAGQQDGDVSTVNGSVHVAGGASVRKAGTVNGAVELGDKAHAGAIDTVNGAISIGRAGQVSGDVSAVNGRIQLAPDADVGGALGNVNGTIALDAAHVAGGIHTVDGDITVGANSRVEGGILVEKPNGWFHFNSRKPQVVIGPHAVVRGTLKFEREVDLKVSDSAQIGPVTGATAVKFSGATP